MKRFRLFLLFTLLPLSLFADSYAVDHAHSKVTFSVKHLIFSTVHGSFDDFDGNFTTSEKRLQDLHGIVQVATVDTGNPKRDAHLRSAKFFDATAYPLMKMDFLYLQKGKAVVALTIKNVTQHVALHYTLDTDTIHPVLHLDGTISRKAFDLRWSKALESGGLVVSNKVKIALQLHGERARSK